MKINIRKFELDIIILDDFKNWAQLAHELEINVNSLSQMRKGNGLFLKLFLTICMRFDLNPLNYLELKGERK